MKFFQNEDIYLPVSAHESIANAIAPARINPINTPSADQTEIILPRLRNIHLTQYSSIAHIAIPPTNIISSNSFPDILSASVETGGSKTYIPPRTPRITPRPRSQGASNHLARPASKDLQVRSSRTNHNLVAVASCTTYHQQGYTCTHHCVMCPRSLRAREYIRPPPSQKILPPEPHLAGEQTPASLQSCQVLIVLSC